MPSFAGTSVEVVVIGAGQAGLAMSHCLKQRNIAHLLLERNRLGHEWRARRWDTFCLVTPNWQCQLPGFPYGGADPQGFMKRDEIVAYLEGYAQSFAPPLHEGVTVGALRREGGRFFLGTNQGDLVARQVVIATGGYHHPAIPRVAERLPPDIQQLHSSAYKNPEDLPPGAVLVVGTGQSGCQIAEDLHLAGRRVHLATGSAPRVARRYRGKDVVEWLDQMGHYRLPVDQHPLKEAVRAKANHYVTGRDGGRDIDLRKLAREGMRLYGRLADVRGGLASFGDDLAANLDNADAVSESIKGSIDRHIAERGISAPEEPRYVPVWAPRDPPRTLDLRAEMVSAVIFSTGYRPDYGWVAAPVFDGRGHPVHKRGVTDVPGLYFLGLPWLHTWGSGRFCGVGADAQHLAAQIEALATSPAPRASAA